LFNNIVLLVTIHKFDPNPMLVNGNKLKPYMFLEDKILQLVLAKPSDLATNELVETKEPEPLLVEHEDLQLVEFELVNNHLTPSNIKGINVLVHYYHDVLVQDNNAIVSNDQNDMFNKALIDIYILGVSNPKGCIHSQP
jgi:hypothetical protein